MDIIEEDDFFSNDVFILPPENGNETEADSDGSDDEHVGNVNHLPRGILNQPCETAQNDSDDDDYEADDLLPLAELRRRMKANETKESYEKSNWKQNPIVIPDTDIRRECDPKQPSADSRNATTPVDYFKLFFDTELLNVVIEQYNKYALQKNDSLDLSLNELYVFLEILLLSGYGKYPNRRMYWSGEEDVPKIVQNSMRLKRFEKILRYIHFNDNATLVQEDKLYKIRPLIEKLNKNKNAESLLVFRRYIALTFLKSFGTKLHQGRVSNPLREVKFDNAGHIVAYNTTDRRCKHCGKKSQFVCEKCNVALHPKHCFKDFHMK